jgi:arabinogalactan endo-1,4-beta-galactosidase
LTNNSYKAKQIKLEVTGVEKTVVHTDKASKRSNFLTKFGQVVGKSKKSDRIKNSSYIFYHENLSCFIKSINKTKDNVSNKDIIILDDGTIEIPSGLRKEFSFQFTIPENALESYIGKNVSIEYRIKVSIDR